MDLNDVKEQLSKAYLGNPQMEMMALRAVDQIREGIGVLASMGHKFQLEAEAPARATAQAQAPASRSRS